MTTYQTCAPEPSIARHGSLAVRVPAAEFLNGNADQGAHQRANSRDKLRRHGRPLGEARLHEERKVADLVGDFVEEDGDGGGGANGWRRIETGRHGEAVGDVVRKVGAAEFVSLAQLLSFSSSPFSLSLSLVTQVWKFSY